MKKAKRRDRVHRLHGSAAGVLFAARHRFRDPGQHCRFDGCSVIGETEDAWVWDSEILFRDMGDRQVQLRPRECVGRSHCLFDSEVDVVNNLRTNLSCSLHKRALGQRARELPGRVRIGKRRG